MNFIFKLLIHIIIFATSKSQMFRNKTIRLDRFEGICEEHKDALIYLTDIEMRQIKRVFYLSIKINIVKDIPSSYLKLDLSLSRCKSRDVPDSCVKYQNIKVNHLCELLKGEHMPWTPMVTLTKPRVFCPFPKGEYLIQNGTFDGAALSRLPISGWYWKVTARIKDGKSDEVFFCCHTDGYVATI